MAGIKKTSLFFALLLVVLFSGASFVLAQGRDLEVGYPQISGEAPVTTETFLPDYVNYIFNFSLTIAGLLVFAVLIYGGFLYLTSAGDPAKTKDARDRISAAILGLIVLLSAYLILTTVNPQLTILSVPEIIKYEPPEVVEPIPLEEQTLYAQEIPIGQIIDGLLKNSTGEIIYEGALAETRLGRIKNVIEKIKNLSEDLKKKTEELSPLAAQCTCSLASPVCDGCSGGACEGDPCPVRGQINGIRGEIQGILDGTAGSPGLIDRQKELEKETEGLEEKLEDILEAERIMKGCQLSISAGGKPMVLLNSASFWQYKEVLEGQKMVKRIEITRPWGGIRAENDEATFYCTETAFDASALTGFAGGELEEFAGIEGIVEEKILCGTEIPIGGTIDGTESLIQKMLDNLKNISTSVLTEIASAQSLILLSNPDVCVASACSTQCVWVEKTCEGPCPEEGDEGGGETPPGETPPGETPPSLPPPYWPPDIPWPPSSWLIEPVYAQTCSYDCSYCYILPCSGSVCPGDQPKATQINQEISKIQSMDAVIIDSTQKITEVIEEELEEEPTVPLVLKKLNNSRLKFGRCINPSADWLKMMNGEKILTKNVVTCEEAKTICRDVEADYECHSENNPDLYTDYFCAEVSQ